MKKPISIFLEIALMEMMNLGIFSEKEFEMYWERLSKRSDFTTP